MNGTYIAYRVQEQLPPEALELLLGCIKKAAQTPAPELEKLLHVTLLYDEHTPLPADLAGIRASLPRMLVAEVTDIEVFDGGTVVLTLDCPGLAKSHDDLLQVGFNHSRSDYVPHITVLKGCQPLTELHVAAMMVSLRKLLVGKRFTLIVPYIEELKP